MAAKISGFEDLGYSSCSSILQRRGFSVEMANRDLKEFNDPTSDEKNNGMLNRHPIIFLAQIPNAQSTSVGAGAIPVK